MSETVMAQKVLSRTFQKTFALNLLQKDIGIAMDLAQGRTDENTCLSSDTGTVLKNRVVNRLHK